MALKTASTGVLGRGKIRVSEAPTCDTFHVPLVSTGAGQGGLVLYLVAVVLPPLAVLLAGKPFQALLNIILTLAFWVPGVIHAIFVVHNHYADQRNDRLIAAVRRSRSA